MARNENEPKRGGWREEVRAQGHFESGHSGDDGALDANARTVLATPSRPVDPLGRVHYVQARRRRQTVVFSFIAALMTIALFFGTLIGFGVIPVPFMDEFNAEQPLASPGSVPCPPEGAAPVKNSSITVRVMNGTDRSGLAGGVAEELKKRGMQVSWVGNAVGDGYAGTVRLVTGVRGVPAAYTLARNFTKPVIILDARAGVDVDVVLGLDFESLVGEKAVAKLAEQPLQPMPGCLPTTR